MSRAELDDRFAGEGFGVWIELQLLEEDDISSDDRYDITPGSARNRRLSLSFNTADGTGQVRDATGVLASLAPTSAGCAETDEFLITSGESRSGNNRADMWIRVRVVQVPDFFIGDVTPAGPGRVRVIVVNQGGPGDVLNVSGSVPGRGVGSLERFRMGRRTTHEVILSLPWQPGLTVGVSGEDCSGVAGAEHVEQPIHRPLIHEPADAVPSP